MLKKGKEALEARAKNREETVYFNFEKSGRAYFFHLFFGVESLKYLLSPMLCGVLFLWGKLVGVDGGEIYFWFLLFFVCATSFCWFCQILYGVWKWKYEKNVVVTDEGIWIMVFSHLWWNNSYDGKKHFLNASWSLYEWEELEKLAVFTDRIARLFKLKNFKITRWDGTQKIYYLKGKDVVSLIELSDTLMKKRKAKKKDDEKSNMKLDFFERVAQYFEKEIEE